MGTAVSKAVTVTKVKSPMDRQLRDIARQKMWEIAPEAVRYISHVLTSNETIQVHIGKGVVIEQDRYTPREKLAAAEMILSRTVPTLAAVKVFSETERQANRPDVDWAALHREALAIIAERTVDGQRGNGAVH